MEILIDNLVVGIIVFFAVMAIFIGTQETPAKNSWLGSAVVTLIIVGAASVLVVFILGPGDPATTTATPVGIDGWTQALGNAVIQRGPVGAALGGLAAFVTYAHFST